jgi:UDP-N-acetylglucosamine 2-epimerase (non-hydrolysing)
MILITYGTRPEYIKVGPLIEEMKVRKIHFKTLFTGQHKDIVFDRADFVLEMKNYGENRLDSIIQNCMNMPDEWFTNIKYILVQGDTTSVVGLAMAAMHRKIKVIHLEAGLRSYDFENPYPEEYNRKIVSAIADIHLCPTESNKKNLILEGIDEKKCYVVGNTGLDNLLSYKDNITYKNIVLVTLHRRENHDIIHEWFKTINKIAELYPEYEFILPIHPNPNVKKHSNLLTNVNVIDPLSHEELLNILVSTSLVITDSGGLQEECSFLHKKCIVCRKKTERPESVGTTSFLAHDPENLYALVSYNINNPIPFDSKCPYGNGTSAKIICSLFKDLL